MHKVYDARRAMTTSNTSTSTSTTSVTTGTNTINFYTCYGAHCFHITDSGHGPRGGQLRRIYIYIYINIRNDKD